MAIQPIISKPGAVSQRPPIQVAPPSMPLWVPLMMVFVTALSVVALVFSILKAPAEVGTTGPRANDLNIANAETAPVEEGKEMQVKIAELEKNLANAKSDIQRLNEELISVRSNMEGLNANVSIVQNQAAKFASPVNVTSPQPEPTNKN